MYSMIGVLGELGNWERALNIFKEVKEEERDSILYTTILCTLEKSSRVHESLEIFNEMILLSKKITERRNIIKNRNDSLINNSNVNININSKRGNSINDIGNDDSNNDKNKNNDNYKNNITEKNILLPGTRPLIPTIQMYTSIISVLGKNGDWQRAYSLFLDMQNPSSTSTSSPVSLPCSSSSLSSSSSSDQNNDDIKDEKKDESNSDFTVLPSLTPDKVLVFTMIRILEKAGQLDKAALVKQKHSLKISSISPSSSPPLSSSSLSSTSSSIDSSTPSSSIQKPNLSTESSSSSSPSSSSSSSSAAAAAATTTAISSSTPSYSNSPNFNDLIREGKRCGDFRPAVAAADAWLALDR